MDWKTLINEETFSIQGILKILEKSWNFTQNSGKIRDFWLIWHTCQSAYTIMICPLCVIVIIIGVIVSVIGVIVCVQLSQWQHSS